ncbi:hypothetical protein [Salibacterium aidingense]|uniref:hypothetical protein n=1 Tax=Salibacterium aidingense TaxID=384933 RepID=UPI00040B3611|nr:hypothetical protein [Salibacterium aidingense]
MPENEWIRREDDQQLPEGIIYVADSSPLNWLYVLYNTMEEPVRADHEGRVILNLAEESRWLTDQTLELKLRKGVYFQDGQHFTASLVKKILLSFSAGMLLILRGRGSIIRRDQHVK